MLMHLSTLGNCVVFILVLQFIILQCVNSEDSDDPVMMGRLTQVSSLGLKIRLVFLFEVHSLGQK